MHNIEVAFELHARRERNQCPAVLDREIERKMLGRVKDRNLFGFEIKLGCSLRGGRHEQRRDIAMIWSGAALRRRPADPARNTKKPWLSFCEKAITVREHFPGGVEKEARLVIQGAGASKFEMEFPSRVR